MTMLLYSRRYLQWILVALCVASSAQASAVLSQRMYDKLAEINTLREKKQYTQALSHLQRINQNKLNRYEKAMLWHSYAGIYYEQQSYAQAIDAYERILNLNDLPAGIKNNALYNAAQLYLLTEQATKAVAMLQQWLSHNDTNSDAHALLAQAHYQAKQYPEAKTQIEKAIALARAGKATIKERWLLLQRAIYYQQNDIQAIVGVLRELISRYPKTQYWLQLASIYAQANNEKEQLVTLEMAYEQDYLKNAQDLITLAQLYLLRDIPYKAAKLLEHALAENAIENKEKHYVLLAQSWLAAKETERAIKAYENAANLSQGGEHDMTVAQLQLDARAWQAAIKAAQRAQKKGQLKDPTLADLILGISFFYIDNIALAEKHLRQLTDDTRHGRLAKHWLDYITDKKRAQND